MSRTRPPRGRLSRDTDGETDVETDGDGEKECGVRGSATGPDGTRIAYEVHGEGPPVVLLHGSVLSRSVWRGTGYLAALAEHFRVVAVDLRGHGRSDKPVTADAYRREALAADVLAVLDEEGVSAAQVVGYSLGGSVGFTLLATAPSRVISLVSLAGPFGVPPGGVAEFVTPGYDEALADGGMDGLLAAWELTRGEPFDGQTRMALRANDPAAMRALLAAVDRDAGVSPWALPGMGTRTLLVAGDGDAGGLRSVRQAAALMPNARLEVLPGRDHGSLLRPADAVLDLLVPFLLAGANGPLLP